MIERVRDPWAQAADVARRLRGKPLRDVHLIDVDAPAMEIMFGSSNTDDYVNEATGKLHLALETEFASHGIEYGMNFGSMKHLLGI